MYAEVVKLIEDGQFDFNAVMLCYNSNWRSTYCTQPPGISALERLKLAVGNINEAILPKFRFKDGEIPHPSFISQTIYDFELHKIEIITEELRKIGCADLSADIATAFIVELFPVDLCYYLFEEDVHDDSYSFTETVMFSILPFLGELCTEEVYRLFRYTGSLESEEVFYGWKVFEYLDNFLFSDLLNESDRNSCIEEYNELTEAADGIYAKMRHDHLKENEPSYYNMLVAEGRLKRECANAQLWIDRYVDRAIERVKRSDEYLNAQKRGDFMKTVSLLETEDATAKSFAIRLYVYGTYSD